MLDPTLYGLLTQIESDTIVLPAMQRPFVWKEDRIYRLLDSLLRGFPAGAIMLWRTKTLQRHRRVLREFDKGTPQIFQFEFSSDDDKYMVLDGQQRLTSLFLAFKGTYNHRRLYIDVLSGDTEDKDPGDEYYDCQFLTAAEALSLINQNTNGKRHFMPIQSLIKIDPVYAGIAALKKAQEFELNDVETERIVNSYLRCASVLGNSKSLQVIVVDEDPSHQTPIEEVLEIFVRVNSGGLVLYKSDLLMSLLDLKWNDIQPLLQKVVQEIKENRPFDFTRDDVLKSLLLAVDSETRFDRLVRDRKRVESLAAIMPSEMPAVQTAWERLGIILMDNCKIYSERFFRGGHNSLLPFVLYLTNNPKITNENRRKLVIGIYISIMSGIFSSAEARMGSFARNIVAKTDDFPLKQLALLVRWNRPIDSLDLLLKNHLDLTLNLAHGGIMLDKNPDQLQRDHIFPRSTLEAQGYPYELVNHYANFHFLRASDNGNKSNKPPQEWFRNPGIGSSYTDQDLQERLLSWDLLEPGQFERLIEVRGRKIREKAEELFGLSENEMEDLFSD